MHTTAIRRGAPAFPERVTVDQLCVVGKELPLPERNNCVAVVGSRAATEYGLHMTSNVTRTLVEEGITVVSGGAFGVDITAHTAALNDGGQTIVVLPSGIDRLHPQAHWPVFAQIGALSPEYHEPAGWLVSQFENHEPPSRSNFFARNLTIAELSGALIVTEAGPRSGSMNAARQAHEAGVPVFAMPGPATSAQSVGCHDLIRRGVATILTDVSQVIETVQMRGA